MVKSRCRNNLTGCVKKMTTARGVCLAFSVAAAHDEIRLVCQTGCETRIEPCPSGGLPELEVVLQRKLGGGVIRRNRRLV